MGCPRWSEHFTTLVFTALASAVHLPACTCTADVTKSDVVLDFE